jgi:hypothetical protein
MRKSDRQLAKGFNSVSVIAVRISHCLHSLISWGTCASEFSPRNFISAKWTRGIAPKNFSLGNDYDLFGTNCRSKKACV